MNAMSRLKDWLFSPPVDGPAATILLRLMAGGVFVSEGVLKFVHVSQGVGRFTKLGFPLPHLTASVVGAWEICRARRSPRASILANIGEAPARLGGRRSRSDANA